MNTLSPNNVSKTNKQQQQPKKERKENCIQRSMTVFPKTEDVLYIKALKNQESNLIKVHKRTKMCRGEIQQPVKQQKSSKRLRCRTAR